jgi:urate oxidase
MNEQEIKLPKWESHTNSAVLYWKQRARMAEAIIREADTHHVPVLEDEIRARLRLHSFKEERVEASVWSKDVPYDKLKGITRLTVVDAKGRSYENYNIKELSPVFQDGDKTLKIFIKEK